VSETTRRPLPIWPLAVVCGLVPLWWSLGLFFLGWPALGLLLAVVLLTRGRIIWPPATRWWLLLVALVLLSAVRIDRPTGYLTFGLRVGFLVTAFVVYVYVYTVAREGGSWQRLLRPLTFFWLAVVALGWLGVLAPTFTLDTLLHQVLPGRIAGTRFITSLTVVRANEFNALSSSPIYRTAAPYPYTNNWGTGYALLLPAVLAYLTSVRTGALRIVLWVALPVSVVPAFLTLNRGMFLGLGAGLLWMSGRALLRGRPQPILWAGALTLLFGLFSLVIPVQQRISERVATTDTNVDRMDLYVQTWHEVMRSPLLGYGVPNSVDTTLASEPLGTQGMLWNIMYSHGVPALLVLILLLLTLTRRLAGAVTPAGQWLSTVPVIALAIMPFYGYLDPNLTVIFYAAGAGMAARQGPVNRERLPSRHTPVPVGAR
jgi:hypothetical protein